MLIKQEIPGTTPLYIASQNGHKVTVELLLNTNNIDINKPDKTHEMTPLCIASKNGHIQLNYF